MSAHLRKPWDWPQPMPSKGEARRRTLYTAIGSAITAWEEVENAMTMMFALATGMEFYQALGIYSGLPSSASKQTIVRSALAGKYPGDSIELKYAKSLVDLVESFSQRRNEIAHSVIFRANPGFLLGPPFHIGKKFADNIPKYQFDAKTIKGYESSFRHLFMEVSMSIFIDGPYLPTAYTQTPLSQFVQPWKDDLQKRHSAK